MIYAGFRLTTAQLYAAAYATPRGTRFRFVTPILLYKLFDGIEAINDFVDELLPESVELTGSTYEMLSAQDIGYTAVAAGPKDEDRSYVYVEVDFEIDELSDNGVYTEMSAATHPQPLWYWMGLPGLNEVAPETRDVDLRNARNHIAAITSAYNQVATAFDEEPIPVQIKNPDDNVRDLVISGACWLEIEDKSLYVVGAEIEIYNLGDEAGNPITTLNLFSLPEFASNDDLEAARETAANLAFENHTFEHEVLEHNGWDREPGLWSKSVFLKNPAGGDSIKVTYTVTWRTDESDDVEDEYVE